MHNPIRATRSLSEALAAPGEDLLKRLSEPSLNREFASLQSAFHKRITGPAYRALTNGEPAGLSSALGVSPQVAQQLVTLHRQLESGRQAIRAQTLALAQARGPQLSR